MRKPPPPVSPIRFLLFDLDGTLIETLADIAESVNYALGRLGLPARTREEVRSFVGRGVQHLLLRAVGEERANLLEEGLRLFREHYDVHCLDQSTLLPGARECLDYYDGRDLAVISNKPEVYVRRMLEALRIDPFFSIVFGGDSLEEKKPSPLMAIRAVETFGHPRRAGVLVGDLPVDVETGKAAGIHTVAVLGGFGTEEELVASDPDRIISTLHDLPKLYP
jgi:phosphoglycolate phosphatase